MNVLGKTKFAESEEEMLQIKYSNVSAKVWTVRQKKQQIMIFEQTVQHLVKDQFKEHIAVFKLASVE